MLRKGLKTRSNPKKEYIRSEAYCTCRLPYIYNYKIAESSYGNGWNVMERHMSQNDS